MSRWGTKSARIVAILLTASALRAQAKLTVNQLYSFIQSSIKLKHPDRQVATYLSKLKLAERLEFKTVEELQGLGAGPATVEALRKLAEGSVGLPLAAPKAETIAPTPIPPPPIEEQNTLIDQVR